MTVPHKPDEKTRKQVEQYSAVGIRQDTIADILDIDPKTLRKHYRKELDCATARANAAVGGKLYQKAIDGDVTAMIFWMKTRAKWSDRPEDSHDDYADPVNVEIIRTDASRSE